MCLTKSRSSRAPGSTPMSPQSRLISTAAREERDEEEGEKEEEEEGDGAL